LSRRASRPDDEATPPSEAAEGVELEQRHLFGQLFAALTARHRDEDGHLCIGVTKQDLLDALHTTPSGLTQLLDLLRQQVTPLGLELVEYRLGRETHYCLRTLYGVPGELTDAEYAVLGIIIASMEAATTRHRTPKIQPKDLEAVLVARGRLSSYQLDKILHRLADLAYITRSTNWITYGARTELEFDEERRKAIADAATVYLAGTASPSSENGESK
jgi:hypothetical protein